MSPNYIRITPQGVSATLAGLANRGWRCGAIWGGYGVRLRLLETWHGTVTCPPYYDRYLPPVTGSVIPEMYPAASPM